MFGRRSDLDLAIDEALGGAEVPPYGEFALTLYAFIRRLSRALDDKGAVQVLFCAREGQLLTRLFDHYQESTRQSSDRIEATYFLVSRRATLIASLGPLVDEDFARLTANIGGLTNAGLLHSLALADSTTDSAIDREALLDLDAIKADEIICNAYESRRIDQRDMLIRYIEQLVTERTSELHVVDVGWKGSIQDHLARAVRDRWSVHGYYLGLVAERPIQNLESKTSLVFGPDNNSWAHYRVLKHFKAIWEYVLAADHGSTQGYQASADRSVVAVLDPNRVELADFERVVSGIQLGLTDVFVRLCRSEALGKLSDLELQELVARRHSRMLFFPTRTELEIARSRGHYANFGNPWVKEIPADDRPGFGRRLTNFLGLVRNPRVLFKRFPPLELHRLGLDPLIPIVGRYRLLREFPPRGFRVFRRRGR